MPPPSVVPCRYRHAHAKPAKAKAMTIKNEASARRIVSARLQAYFEMIRQYLSTSSAEFSKRLEADLALTEDRDNFR